jgi:hypothetical protein
MSLLSYHDVRTGQLVTSADILSISSLLEGEFTINPTNPPLLEDGGTSGSLLANTSYTYSYSYMNWRVTNGVFEITNETAPSPPSSFTTSSGSNNKQIKVWFDPPSYGAANGVIIYRSDAGDTSGAVRYVLDISTDNIVDGLASTSRGKTSIAKNTFQVGQPFIGSGQLGPKIPIPLNIDSSRIITTNLPYFFDRDEDFLLMGMAWKQQAEIDFSWSVMAYSAEGIYNAPKIWINEQESASSITFGHPVPIPRSTVGIVRSSSVIDVSIYGMYLGLNRKLSESGSIKAFTAKIQGPWQSPLFSWACPINSRAIIVHACPLEELTTTSNLKKDPTKSVPIVLVADSVSKRLNKDTTYSGDHWILPPARISAPSTLFAGGNYGNWNKVPFNAFAQPLIMEQTEIITTYTAQSCQIWGYVIDYAY